VIIASGHIEIMKRDKKGAQQRPEGHWTLRAGHCTPPISL